MQKKLAILIIPFIFLTLFSNFGYAKSDYIYRSRANWVKLEKLSKKQLAGQILAHPFKSITTDQLVSMLMSLKMSKAQLFSKEIKTQEVFSIGEARKFAPIILKAFRKADPNEVVNVSMVHKRPHFVIRNDYLSMMNFYVTDEGLHVHFMKLFAKLKGEYKQASKMYQEISKSKGIRVSLEAVPGQTLLAEVDEVIFDLNYDFVNNVTLPSEKVALDYDDTPEDESKPKKEKSKKKKSYKKKSSSSDSVQSRLSKLKNLYDEGLISKKDYDAKKGEILSDL